MKGRRRPGVVPPGHKTGREKALHHQIHPLKPTADLSVGFLNYYLLWRRRPRLLVIGHLLVLFGWLRGMLFPRRQA